MITRRGKRVRGLAIALAVFLILWGLWQVTANLWATPNGEAVIEEEEERARKRENFLAFDYRTPALSGRCVVAYR